MYWKVNMLLEWADNIDGLEETLARFKTHIEELRSEMPDDPEQVFSKLMEEMMVRARANRKEKESVGGA
jgi:hypothetical protein